MAAIDLANASNDITAPAGRFAAVTPSDSADFSFVTRALYVGGDGTVVAVDANGTAVSFVGVVAGTILPIRVSRVNSTSTTATNIVAMW
ncbi:spike base protein, RCAP_Rcc01079 family [Agrobacterium radiobacter]|uniref:spike base protein, RCAP_Rcc01079 family n=1 Tax=Agrobacterium radiobacter TaxID=362 RepID=UPI003F827678